jgi:hypothetical protein
VTSRRRIRKKRIMRHFPQLKANNFRITSRRTPLYNCIAWAVGKDDDWWEWRRGYTWPNAPRAETVAAAIALFESQGFEKCAGRELQVGWEKVAIYGDQQGYTHAARQLDTGHWSSKIGKLEDIEHKYLDDLVGGDYGQVVQIMRKKKGV